MKICFVNSNKFWGGAEKWHVRAASYLASRGHEVVFFARAREVSRPLSEQGLDVRLLPFKSDLDPMSLVSLSRELRRFRPEVVIFNSERDLRLGGAAAALSGIGVRVHRKGISGIKNNVRYKWIYRNLRTHTLCVSEAVREEVAALGWVTSSSLRVIYSGVDLDEFNPEGPRKLREELGIGDGELLIGSLSRLSSIKGLEYFLKAVPLIREGAGNARFAVVGTGRIEGALQSLAENLGLGGVVRFTGFRPDAADVLRSFDILVHPSVHTEGFPNSIIEAMACARPVVASRVAGIPEAVVDGETGLLIEPRDKEAIADAVMKLVRDARLRRRMGNAAIERVRRLFDFNDKMRELEDWLLEITTRVTLPHKRR